MKIFLCEHAEKVLVCSRNFLSFYNRRNPNITSTNIFQKIYWNFRRIFGLRKRFLGSFCKVFEKGNFFENLTKLPDGLSWLGPYLISTFNCLRHQRMILRQTKSRLLIKKKTHIVRLKTVESYGRQNVPLADNARINLSRISKIRLLVILARSSESFNFSNMMTQKKMHQHSRKKTTFN